MRYYLTQCAYEDAVILHNILSLYAYDNENCTIMSYTIRLSERILSYIKQLAATFFFKYFIFSIVRN